MSIRIIAKGGGGIEALRIEESPIPKPQAGEAVVRLRAASLNYRDLIGVRGALPGMTKEPDYVPLSCGAGEVVAVGAGVTHVRVGSRVSPIFAQGWLSGGAENMGRSHLGGSVDGVARSHAAFDAENLVLLPDTIGDLEAATLPCAGITAWSAITLARAVRPGDLVLVQGTGGVSIAALQFAKAAGAEVIVTSSSDAKLARARALGADYLVNYRTTPDWAGEARRVAGRGADLVVDVVGTGSLEASATSLAPGGAIAAIGMLDGGFSWGAEIGVPVVPVTVGSRDAVEAMLRAITANRIRPVVDRVWPLDRLADALRALETGAFFGKIGIAID
ncbi:zinc-dependent alcohol dehydrogenase family protein [Sphingomonas immobilis]|uniref:NAD(P)-dependent alcohol dehydrogenase n=1 Tax=Sphingomonas immobilis TaxID=3063997 RepID=A0ABT8ZXA8_9SPHN|nr:NAD(P)-dependent alcohol dehydrogenase [Sphingomonas sp. CA1-15]MDO7842186.1 NAD(P)-dependent alcohol dehydrogenase [Sphingomonas sp. CA1-15]